MLKIKDFSFKKGFQDLFNKFFVNNYTIVTTGIFFAVALIFVTLSIYKKSKENIIEEFQKHQLTSVESAARGIEVFIKNIVKDLHLLKKFKAFQVNDFPTKRETLENLFSLYKKDGSFLSSLYCYDKQGVLQVSIPFNELEGNVLEENFPSPKNQDSFKISKLFFTEKNEGKIQIIIPILNEESGGNFLGTLAADINVKKMANYFIGNVNLNGNYVSILDMDGTIIDHPCPQFLGKNINDIDIKRIDVNNKVFPFQENKNLLDIFIENKEGTLRVIDFGRLELLSFAPIRLIIKSWIMIMNIPYSEISGPIVELQKRFTVIMLGIIILMTVGSFLFVLANQKRLCTETKIKLLTKEIQLEEKIKKSEAKLRAILHSINDCIIILDQNFTIIWSNDNCEGNKFIGKKCYQIRNGLHTYCLKCPVKDSFSDRESHIAEVVGEEKDQKFFYQMCSSPILDNDGKVLNVVEMTRDISDIRKMDILIRESERRYRNLVEQMNEGLMVINSENKITFINNKFCHLFRGNRKKIIEKNYDTFLNEKNQEKFLKAIEKSKKYQASSIELEIETTQGKSLTLICSLSALFDEQIKYQGASIVFTEITERRKLEKEIQVSRDKLRAILKSLRDGVVIIDKKYTIQYMNESSKKIFGDKIKKICHQSLYNHPEPCDLCLAKEIFEGRQNLYLTKDSVNGRILDISASPIVMEDGTISLLKVFRDITEKKQLETRLLESEQIRLRDLKERYRFGNIIGKNYKMQEIYDLISVVSQSFTTVLIQGHSGTGKELIASSIHFNSPQHNKPFIGVSCSALPDGLLESELFGHVKGSFTGAIRDKMGRFEMAGGGTLFLDEIGEISPLIQVKLLRVLQERQFERVGSLKTITVNVRVIAATNKNLKKAVARGEFREDLYYRLNVVNIELPPLNERSDDIPLFVNHFIEQFNKKLNKNILSISASAMNYLISYDWPGNIRQLENVIEYSFICAKGKRILPENLPLDIVNIKKKKQDDDVTLEFNDGKIMTLDESEALMIAQALQKTGSHLGNTAQVLGIARSTLWRLMKKHKIDKNSSKKISNVENIISLKEKIEKSRKV